MFKRIGLIVLAAIGLPLAAGLLLSPEFNVEQSIVIQAGPEAIHPYVNDLKHWQKWTPWREADRGVRYGDLTQGVGASQSWRGRRGSGHLHITASSPVNGIAYDVFFGNDTVPAISAIEYTRLDNGSTRVSWRIHGEVDMPVLGGYFAIMAASMIRDRYQTGLARLKSVVENGR